MVASFMDKAVTKSYIRLPGSGNDKNAGVSFCDLSLGSNLAASIPVPQHVGMPRYLTNRTSSSHVNSTTSNKRPRPEHDNVENNASNKRPHMESTNQNEEPIDLTLKPATVSTDSVTASSQEISSNTAPATAIPNNEPVNAGQNPVNLITINTQYDVTKLQEENNQLRSENAILHKQVLMFKQLVRNPQQLKSVLQRLKDMSTN